VLLRPVTLCCASLALLLLLAFYLQKDRLLGLSNQEVLRSAQTQRAFYTGG
jgi:hypothetical protein